MAQANNHNTRTAQIIHFVNKLETRKAAMWLIFIYITFVNVFILKVSPELLALQFFLIVFLFMRSEKSQFLRDWIPYIALFFLYEFLRGYADDLSPFYNNTLYAIHFIEEKLFGGTIPTITLQNLLYPNVWLLYFLLLFYSSFFYFSFVVGFIIWWKKNADFHDYFRRFMLLSFIGLIFYFLIPTAPPWFVDRAFRLGVDRELFINTFFSSFSGGSLTAYFIEGNPVAAFPSLHTAWTAFTAIYVVKKYGKKFWPVLIVPTMVGFSIILTGEHYILDVFAGWVLAYGIVHATSSSFNYFLNRIRL